MMIFVVNSLPWLKTTSASKGKISTPAFMRSRKPSKLNSSWERKVSTQEDVQQMQQWGVTVGPKWLELHSSTEIPFLYRIIGQVEKASLEAGETILGERYAGREQLNVTTNSNYASIARTGKYLVKFKLAERFDPLAANTNILDHDVEKDEFYLVGGYSMDDVESITAIGPLH
jgi:hypothetical protein